MSKTNKAAAVLEMLNKGLSIKQIRDRMDVSPSYVHTLKKKMVHKEEEPKPGEFIQADTNVDAILNARGSTYGSFVDVSRMAQRLKNVIRLTDIERRGGTLPLDHQEALDMIASKIARIVVGDYDHIDSWVDIAGYAKLVADRLQGNVR
jgi:hypothetical protein